MKVSIINESNQLLSVCHGAISIQLAAGGMPHGFWLIRGDSNLVNFQAIYHLLPLLDQSGYQWLFVSSTLWVYLFPQ